MQISGFGTLSNISRIYLAVIYTMQTTMIALRRSTQTHMNGTQSGETLNDQLMMSQRKIKP